MPSKSMSPMPIQTKIGDASLKFGPDWLRALSSSDSGTGGGSGEGRPGGGGWSSGSGGGGGSLRDGGSYSSAASQNQHHHHHHSGSNAMPHRERLSSGTSSSNSTSTNPNRFQPPEFGYGREEMLALFDKNLPPPVFLPAFGTLFIEKMQPPLAFSQPSEEELRVWHVPQPESSRQSNSGPPPMGRGTFPVRGRGTGSDRGRGRGRGGGGGYYGRPHEEDDRSFSRPRTFERSQSAHERVWAERNGGTGGPVPSPPEDSGARGGSWRTRESYGNKRYENDDDGWRKPRWRKEDDEETPPRSNSRRLHKSWSDDGAHDLPEWAKDNPSEESGTFDASGAFHEEDRYSAKSNAFEQNRREMERNNREGKGESEPYGSQNDRVQKRTPERNDVKAVIRSSVLEEEPEETPPEVDRLNNAKHYRSNESKADISNTSVTKSTSLRSEEPLLPQSNESSPMDMANDILTPHHTPPLSDMETGNRQPMNQTQSRIHQPNIEPRLQNNSRNLNQLQEEHYYNMTEEADMVAKLIEDDGSSGTLSSLSLSSSMGAIPPSSNHVLNMTGVNSNLDASNRSNISAGSQHMQAPLRPPSPTSFEVWFYRDPQGSVQGPFATHEMAQWYSQGYFTAGLLLRRDCDKVFITLGEMGKMYSRNPFIVIPDSPPPPPLMDSSPSALDNSQDSNLQAQYHQRHLLQQSILREQQQYLLKMNQSGIRKENEAWQGQPHPQYAQSGAGGPSQAQMQAQMLLNMAKQAGIAADDPNPIEHLQAMFNRQAQVKANEPMGNSKNAFINPMMTGQMNAQMDLRKSPTQVSPDPIQSLVQQLTSLVNPQTQPKLLLNKPMDTSSHWGSPGVPTPPLQQQMGGWPNQSQPNNQNQMWEYREQFLKLQQQQKLDGEMLRQKKEEEMERKRIMEEEERKRLEEQQRFEAEEHEKNRKLMEEQYLLQKKQQEELQKQQAEMLIQQRLRQQELERQQQLYEQQQRLEQQRAEQQRQEQQRLEQQRIEQQLRQEQLEREEQQRRVQLELEEQRRQQQEHEEKQRQHQQRLQEEQEAAKQQEMQQKFAWMTSHVQQVQTVEPSTPAPSLLEIQQEEVIKEQESALRQQAAKKTKMMQQEQARLQREAKSGLSLKWAQTAQPQKVATKSFAEIQAEEQAKLAKQQEKDREQRAIVNQHTQLQQAWSSSLTWANRASLNAPATTPKLNGGIWDDPPNLGAATASNKGKSNAGSNNPSPSNAGSGSGNVVSSNKQTNVSQQGQAKKGAKESDEAFMKLFQEHGMSMKNSTRTQTQQDEFTRWCCETVESIGGGGIDIATFVSFLKEVESPFEILDYVRSYLGDGRDAREFGKEFLERRSRWKNARKDQDKDGGGFEDNLCRPAYAVNPTQSEFQEVKVKGKKGKKGKMQKVDSRILGFNTTSAPDRVNVGKRDYGDGTD